jgi:hypothetical protein
MLKLNKIVSAHEATHDLCDPSGKLRNATHRQNFHLWHNHEIARMNEQAAHFTPQNFVNSLENTRLSNKVEPSHHPQGP